MDKEKINFTKRPKKKDKEVKTFDIYGKNTTKGLRRKMDILEITESKQNIENYEIKNGQNCKKLK